MILASGVPVVGNAAWGDEPFRAEFPLPVRDFTGSQPSFMYSGRSGCVTFVNDENFFGELYRWNIRTSELELVSTAAFGGASDLSVNGQRIVLPRMYDFDQFLYEPVTWTPDQGLVVIPGVRDCNFVLGSDGLEQMLFDCPDGFLRVSWGASTTTSYGAEFMLSFGGWGDFPLRLQADGSSAWKRGPDIVFANPAGQVVERLAIPAGFELTRWNGLGVRHLGEGHKGRVVHLRNPDGRQVREMDS